MGESLAIRRLTPEQKQIALAMSIFSERLRTLSESDVKDLAELQIAWRREKDQEERDRIMELMEDILAGLSEGVGELRSVPEPRNLPANKDLAIWLGKEVARLRQEKGMTQEQLGVASGLPQSHISRIENGVYFATQITRDKLAKALGVEARKLDPVSD